MKLILYSLFLYITRLVYINIGENYEANIAEREMVGRIRVVEREATVFGGEFVSMVDTVVAGGA